MKKFLLLILAAVMAASFGLVSSFAEGEEIYEFDTSFDFFEIDGKTITLGPGHGGPQVYTYDKEPIVIEEFLGLGGWCAVEDGVSKYQYSVNGEEFVDIDVELVKRPDLANAGIAYQSGHDTAGFNTSTFRIPASAIPYAGSEVTIRVVTTTGDYADILIIENISVVGQEPTPTPEVTPTPEATEAPTEAPEATEAPTAAPTEAPAESSGCGSILGGGFALLVIMGAAAFVFKKR